MPDRADSPPDTDPRLDAAGRWCLRLAEGALGPEEQARFQAWLDADPENLRAFEDAVGVWRAVGETSLTPEVLGMRRDALHGFEAAKRERWGGAPGRRPARWIPAAAAAALLLVVGGAVAARLMLAPADYRTGVGERRVLVLRDGSKISLDAATEVKVRYTGHARRLWLERGRAKFDVAKDAARPFTVAAADKVVRATGTEFTVELLRGEVQVVLYEGHVAVLETGEGAKPEPLRLAGAAASGAKGPAVPVEADEVLTPGRELTAPVKAATAEVSPIDPVRSAAWEGGQLFFDHEPLATAVERMNRYSREKLGVGDA